MVKPLGKYGDNYMDEKFWKGKNVFLTGASGMVGGHIAQKLVSCNANVIALARSRDPKAYFYSEKLDKKIVLAYGDLKDFQRICDILTRYEIETILHLGAQPIVGTALINPIETFRTNVEGTVNILEGARKSPLVKQVVVASSDKAYGKSAKLPYTEDMALRGDAPYEVSKSCADLISLSYAETYNMPITVTRFGNIYGPGDLNFNRIVPGAIRAGLADSVLDIRSDGKMIREYLYVEDVANGYLMLAENIKKTKGEAFNFSSGERLMVMEVVEKIGKMMRKKIKTKILNIAKNEIYEQYLSSNKVRKLLGWKAEYNFEKGLKVTIPWYKQLLG